MHKRFIILVAIFIAFAWGGSVFGSSLCDQKFIIYGKTKGDHAILFWEVFIGGECYHWYTHALFLGYDQPYMMTTPRDDGGKDWIPQILTELQAENSVLLEPKDGIYYITEEVSFTPPELDSTFNEKHNRLINYGSADARHWYRECPVNCSDYPVFKGAEAELIYFYDRGLYKNYGFSQAVFFPESDYLVLVTDQPSQAMGGDSMHGLLVYRLLFEKEE